MNIPQDLNFHYGLLLGLVPPWCVVSVDLQMERKRVVIEVHWPYDQSVFCPECGVACRMKDHRDERSWRHLDTMQFETLVTCRVPRADCPVHGAKTLQVPWAGPHSRFTLLFERFAIEVLYGARSITQATALLGISWDQAQSIQERAVDRGISRRKLEEIKYVGIDEKNFGKGHDYVSVMSDISKGCVLNVIPERTKEATLKLWETIPQEQRGSIRAVAMDMWEAFMNVTGEVVPHADIVHDKFHCSKYLGEAVDKVRKQENRELAEQGNDVLKGTKFLWLRNPKNWNEKQQSSFEALRSEELKVSRAWAIRQSFNGFWDYWYRKPAEKYFRQWYYWATHSRLKPMIEVARTLKRHLKGILNYCKHRITNAVAEGLNSKIQTLKTNARGFRNFDHYRISILFHCGKLDVYP
jgi:transposase